MAKGRACFCQCYFLCSCIKILENNNLGQGRIHFSRIKKSVSKLNKYSICKIEVQLNGQGIQFQYYTENVAKKPHKNIFYLQIACLKLSPQFLNKQIISFKRQIIQQYTDSTLQREHYTFQFIIYVFQSSQGYIVNILENTPIVSTCNFVHVTNWYF